MSVTPASAALFDLVETLKKLDRLIDIRPTQQRDLTPAEDRQYGQLEERREALERQLHTEVRDKLGIDYGVLWHAVTPSGPAPTRKGKWII